MAQERQMQQPRALCANRYYPQEAIQIQEACKNNLKATQMTNVCAIRNKKMATCLNAYSFEAL